MRLEREGGREGGWILGGINSGHYILEDISITQVE